MKFMFITGTLGSGKSLISVRLMQEYLNNGGPVATNLDLKLEHLINVNSKNCRVIRLPDKPTAEDILAIGSGNDSYDESKNGFLCLDELGTWFNSRNWNDKSRAPLIDALLHIRKKGWDVGFIVQDLDLIDKQVRVSMVQFTVFCKNLSDMAIPIFGFLYSLVAGKRLKMPHLHVGLMVAGDSRKDPISERYWYKGTELYQAYDTKQIYSSTYSDGIYSYLPPWHTTGRYKKKLTFKRCIRMIKLIVKKNAAAYFITAGILAGAGGASLAYSLVDSTLIRGEEIVLDVPIEIEEKPLTLREKFKNYISNSISSLGGTTTYTFLGPNGEFITSDSPELKDVHIQEMGYCMIRLFDKTESIVLGCQG